MTGRDAGADDGALRAPPAVDWTGKPLDCGRCPNAALHADGRCAPAHACVFDRHARRVDRFLRWNPACANDYLGHPYFEVRAIACRYADLFRIGALASDPDETVRLSAALRLPQRLLAPMARDTDREVRIRVAQRLAPERLHVLIDDPDYYVRVLVARRLPLPRLPRLRDDPDPAVRIEVARRLPAAALLSMVFDPEIAVRRVVARRLPADLLGGMRADDAWVVRWELTQRGDAALLRMLATDAEPDVAHAARERLGQLALQDSGRRHA